jgi:hypothetical protein
MNRVRLEFLIAHRIVLSPREAATLTLAVARQWDSRRAAYGGTALPDANAIVLHRTGEITFLSVARAHPPLQESLALSRLFSRLLGSPSLLPEVSLESTDDFRTALASLADDGETALRMLFVRVADEIEGSVIPLHASDDGAVWASRLDAAYRRIGWIAVAGVAILAAAAAAALISTIDRRKSTEPEARPDDARLPSTGEIHASAVLAGGTRGMARALRH